MSARELRIYGPPGTGKRKTTYLKRRVEATVKARGQEGIRIASLTRAAASEIAHRVTLPFDAVGTLHAHAYRALDEPDLAETPEGLTAWNERAGKLGEAFVMATRKRAIDLDDAAGEALIPASEGEGLLQTYSMLRAKCWPRKRWPPAVVAFAEHWERFKKDTGRLDFNDLIEHATEEIPVMPGTPSVFLLDEAQDMSKLDMRLARQWGRACEVFVVVGDPDQCQPAGTLVRTAVHGDVPIEALNPDVHRLVSFDRHSSTIVGRRDGYPFTITSRGYSGELVTLTAAGRSTRTTHDHRWPVQWSPESRDKCVVYLMRRGNDWRVGWCKLHGANGLHLKRRAALEGAHAWILAAFDHRRDASIYETRIAVEYGLPMPTFREDDVYAALNPLRHELADRAHRCLFDHHRDPRHPFIDPDDRYAKQGARTSMIVRACNLVDGLFLVPVPTTARHCTWQPFTVTRKPCQGLRVWSMNVEPHHNYIADGIVTMNNLYHWRGADPEAFYGDPRDTDLDDLDEHDVHVLDRSYRVPATVHAYAVEWLVKYLPSRSRAEYHPRHIDPAKPELGEAPGVVRRSPHTFREPEQLANDLEQHLADGQRVMVLTATGYMLEPLMAVLRRRGVPYGNPYRGNDGRLNPLAGAGRIRAYLAGLDRDWTWGEVRAWAEPLKAKDVFHRGGKAFIDAKCQGGAMDDEPRRDIPADFEAVMALLTDEARLHLGLGDLDYYEQQLRASRAGALAYSLNVARRHGPQALSAMPQADGAGVILGTIHSVKGGEAEVVYVFPDLSRAGYEGWHSRGPRHDAVARQLYVAFTRAREELVLCERSGGFAVPWPIIDLAVAA